MSHEIVENAPEASPTFHIITVEDLSIRTEALPHVKCTCGFETEPSNNLANLGIEAFKHAAENPGHILRPHTDSPLMTGLDGSE